MWWVVGDGRWAVGGGRWVVGASTDLGGWLYAGRAALHPSVRCLRRCDRFPPADFLTVAASASPWPALQVAVACRLTGAARSALRHGQIDPSACGLPAILAAAASPADQLWPGSPPPTPETTKLAREAMAEWAPTRHFLFHPWVRCNVRTVLLVALRLRAQLGEVASGSARRSVRVQRQTATALLLPELPTLIWRLVCSFFRRSDWD